jgi:hypothetical protein
MSTLSLIYVAQKTKIYIIMYKLFTSLLDNITVKRRHNF